MEGLKRWNPSMEGLRRWKTDPVTLANQGPVSYSLCHPHRNRYKRMKVEIPGFRIFSSGRVRPRQGTEICNFGALSPLDFLVFSCGFFSFLSRLSVYNKEIAPKCGENCRFPGGEESIESCHVSGCYGFSVPLSLLDYESESERKSLGFCMFS